LELGLCGDGFSLVDDASLLVNLVIDDRAAKIQRVFEDVERVNTVRAPRLSGFDREGGV
jgi:hypothetical protein